MKIKKITSLAIALVLAVAFVGCSKTSAGNNTEDNNNNNTTQNQQENNNNEDKDDKDDKNDVNDKDTQNDIEDDKEKEFEEKIIVYSYDIEKDKLVENEVSVKKDDPQSVFESLKKLGVVPKDSKMNSFDITEADGVDTGLLDVDAKFVNTNLGSGAESLMLDAVAQTFIENFDIDQIQLTVDGGAYESGHVYLGEGDYLKPANTGLNQGTGEDVEADEN